MDNNTTSVTSPFLVAPGEVAATAYDTRQLDIAIVAMALGWQLQRVGLHANAQTGRKFGHFYFQVPPRIDVRAFDRELTNETLVAPVNLAALGRIRKKLKVLVQEAVLRDEELRANSPIS